MENKYKIIPKVIIKILKKAKKAEIAALLKKEVLKDKLLSLLEMKAKYRLEVVV